jgi:GAF domain-containing protein
MTSCDPTAAFPGDPRDRVALLSDAASALSAALDVEAVMRALARAFVPAVCDGFEVALRAPDGTLQRIVLGADGIPGWRQREAVPVPELEIHPVRQALRTLRPMVISLADPEQEILFGDPHDPTSARALGITQAIVAPMLGRSAAAGTVAVGIGPSGRTFLEGDAGLIASIARLAGLALENLEAKEQQARTTAMLERAAAVSFAIATAGGEEAVTQAAVALAREELGAATGFVYLLDGAESKLRRPPGMAEGSRQNLGRHSSAARTSPKASTSTSDRSDRTAPGASSVAMTDPRRHIQRSSSQARPRTAMSAFR